MTWNLSSERTRLDSKTECLEEERGGSTVFWSVRTWVLLWVRELFWHDIAVMVYSERVVYTGIGNFVFYCQIILVVNLN
jgi:hypothetical protein